MTTSASSESPSLVWFRNDLRLADNPALHAAVERGAPLLCLFVFEEDAGLRRHGAASRWWLHHSLEALAADLAALGGRLDLVRGKAATVIPAVADAAKAGAVFWNRRYGGAATDLDTAIKTTVSRPDRHVESFNGRLIHEPWELKTKTGGSYGVYTPYWKAAIALGDTSHPLARPRKLDDAPYPAAAPKRTSLKAEALLPTKPDWSGGLAAEWTPGEVGARARLTDFLDGDLSAYETDRNLLGVDGTSRLSPHLRFGEISPRQIVAAATRTAKTPAAREGTKKFLSEIGWREFDYHVMFHHPDVATVNLHRQFDAMDWRKLPKAELDAWKQGRTGYPVVDAGMRELWTTGYMHNRVRMITASFLIKHLLCDWRIGEQWFWDCLCDADPANNTMNWQWVAGSGADASPFFRVFNPILQGQKFDPDGTYVRRHVPELAGLPDPFIHEPWKASSDVLSQAGIELGRTYPHPMIDHAEGRARALAAYEKVKGSNSPSFA